MTLGEKLASLKEQLAELPEGERLGYFKGWVANHSDAAERASITAMWGVMQALPWSNLTSAVAPQTPAAQRQIVVLLHGIRTQAEWQNRIAQILRQVPNTEVVPIGYGWLDVVRFWSPPKWGWRNKPEKKILREMRDIRAENPDADLVIVAHSFSTYLVSRILDENTDIRLAKLILCGCIIPMEYRWDKVKVATSGMAIVNDVGARDVWPVFARVASWGYGPSGTFGFRTSRVYDRFFDYKHSDFFTAEHVEKYWAPFIETGKIVDSPWDSSRPIQPWHLSVLGGIPYVKLVLVLITSLAAAVLWGLYIRALPFFGKLGQWLFSG